MADGTDLLDRSEESLQSMLDQLYEELQYTVINSEKTSPTFGRKEAAGQPLLLVNGKAKNVYKVMCTWEVALRGLRT